VRKDYFNDPDAPKANAAVPSVTAVVVDAGRLLLVHRADNDLWALPGGGHEVGETIEDTVVRALASKHIYPNVDFYSGLVFHDLGIPTDLFTPVFAVARIAGWTAQVIEYWEDNRLLRPLDWYAGPKDLVYVPIDERP